MGGDGFHGAVDVLHVGRVGTRQLRRADTDEVHGCPGDRFLRVVGEAEPAGAELGGEEVLETRFVERRGACREHVDLRCVGVVRAHLVAQMCHTRGMNGTQIARSHDAYPHGAQFRHHELGNVWRNCQINPSLRATRTHLSIAMPTSVRIRPAQPLRPGDSGGVCYVCCEPCKLAEANITCPTCGD